MRIYSIEILVATAQINDKQTTRLLKPVLNTSKDEGSLVGTMLPKPPNCLSCDICIYLIILLMFKPSARVYYIMFGKTSKELTHKKPQVSIFVSGCVDLANRFIATL